MRNTTGGRNARKKGRYWAAFLVLAVLVLIFMVLSICIGTVNIPVSEIPGILGKNGSDDTYTDIVMGIRFPRAAAAGILGGGLALSGYLLQTFFHNPIAGPFTLGISSGAKLVVALVMVASLGNALRLSSWVMIVAAFVGAMICMGFVILMSKVMDQMSMLIVSGVMIGYICSAITDFVVTFADDADIVNLHNWSKGSFSGMTWDNVLIMAIVVVHHRYLCLSHVQANQRLSDGRSLRQKYGPECAGIPDSAGAVIKRSVGLCDCLCWACVFRGNRGASSGEEPVRDGEADPDDTGLLSGRRGLLPLLRSAGPDHVRSHRAVYQYGDSGIWRAGGHLYYDSPKKERTE